MKFLLSTNFRGDQPFNLNALVYDANGSIITPTPQIDWNITLDFNASDGNNSRVAQLEDSLGNRELNASGEQVRLIPSILHTAERSGNRITGFEYIGRRREVTQRAIGCAFQQGMGLTQI